MTITVLHVMEAFAGGTERHLLDLIRHVPNVEHVIAVPPTHHGKSTAAAAKRARTAGAQVELVAMGRSLNDARRNAAAMLELRRLTRAIDPSIIHGHSSIGGALARVACMRMRRPLVYTPHGLSRAHWAIMVERALSPLAARIVAVSESEAEFARAHLVASGEQLVIIRNGIDLTPPPPLRPSLRERLGIAPWVSLVGSVGRLAWQKAPEVFVEACALMRRRHPRDQYVLIGAGPLLPEVQRAIRRHGLGDQLHLLPSLDNAAAALAEFDVYVLPSRFEGGPYTPLEAMRARIPVVVTDAAGNRDEVQHRTNGMVVPIDDAAAIADAATELLENERLRDAVTSSAHETLTRRYDVRLMGAATAQLYEAAAN